MDRPGNNDSITVDTAWHWLAYAARRPDVRELIDLADDQVMAIAELLSQSPLINPGLVRPRVKPLTYVCQCGCGETVHTTYTTGIPKYKPEHKNRVRFRNYMAKRRARQRATQARDELLKG